MLILTRRMGESIRIGNDVELVVLATGRGQICLGIAAPTSMPIVRSELLASGESATAQQTDRSAVPQV